MDMKGRYMKSLALLFLCCGYFVAMQAQIAPNEDSPTIREKIFIHTDKSFYVTGEIIWFKLYVRDQLLQAARISQLAYVELIGGNRQPVLQAKIALEAGTGSGS